MQIIQSFCYGTGSDFYFPPMTYPFPCSMRAANLVMSGSIPAATGSYWEFTLKSESLNATIGSFDTTETAVEDKTPFRLELTKQAIQLPANDVFTVKCHPTGSEATDLSDVFISIQLIMA